MDKQSHPEFIQIETNIACNAECPFCPHDEIVRKEKRMRDEIWMKIIDETRELAITYRPFLVNEPLTDKRLGRIMRYIRQDATAKIELNTNGELMTEDIALEILDARIDAIRFSIDGFSEESFSKSRVGLDYQKTMDRTLRFIRLANERGGAGMIEVRMIESDDTRGEIEAFREFWRKAGAEPVITPLYRWPWEPGVTMVPLPCLKVLKEMFICADGRATLCCWDTRQRSVIGDVTQEHTLEVWNGELNQRYRRLLSQGKRDQILLCSRCDAYKDYPFAGFSSPASQG
ncbi:MAG: radical SAM/SPASM domain-containing protein [Candidatus Latescibacterota bacterium]